MHTLQAEIPLRLSGCWPSTRLRKLMSCEALDWIDAPFLQNDNFGFHIVNFPFMSSNIPSAPAYGVYASQLIRYARCCSSYSDFLICHRALVKRLLSQGYKVNRLSNTFKKFYGRHTDLVGQYKKNVCQMFADPISWNDFLFWWICQWRN